MVVLQTKEDDIKQLTKLIQYHKRIAADAKLYNRPSEGALEQLTGAYLKELLLALEGDDRE